MGMSGRYAGPVSRLLAFFLDNVFVTLAFTVLTAIVSYAVGLVSANDYDPQDANSIFWAFAALIWVFLYHSVSLIVAGRTPGKTVVGLRVVDRDGTPLRANRAVRRVIAQPFTLLTFGLGFVGLFIGRERRALHDMVAGTAVVYDWGDRPAQLPAPLTRYLARADAQSPGGSDAERLDLGPRTPLPPR